MNERIKELLIQSEVFNKDCTVLKDVTGYELNKFAELIIKKCAKSLWTEECHTSDLALEEFERNSAKIKEHFGVEE
jgi:predicted nucleotidyltransferase